MFSSLKTKPKTIVLAYEAYVDYIKDALTSQGANLHALKRPTPNAPEFLQVLSKTGYGVVKVYNARTPLTINEVRAFAIYLHSYPANDQPHSNYMPNAHLMSKTIIALNGFEPDVAQYASKYGIKLLQVQPTPSEIAFYRAKRK